MRRITEKNTDSFGITRYALIEPAKVAICDHCLQKDDCTECSLQNAISKLAAYEDTGLEPEEIVALCDMDSRAKMAEMLKN